jgi:hypothetical protein
MARKPAMRQYCRPDRTGGNAVHHIAGEALMSRPARILAGLLLFMAPTRHAVATAPAAAPPPATRQYLWQDFVQLPQHAGGLEWQIADTLKSDTETVTELVPAGEHIADWTQMITIKAVSGARDPASIVSITLAIMRGICRKTDIVHLAPHQEIGALGGAAANDPASSLPLPIIEVSETLVTCRDPNAAKLQTRANAARVALKPYEVTWYKVMRCNGRNYIVQRAWHGDAIGDTTVLGSRDVLEEWKNWLQTVTVAREGVGMDNLRRLKK